MIETVSEIRARVEYMQQNYKECLKKVERILISERGRVSEVERGQHVVALMSGGLDSTVMIEKIIDDWDVIVHPLFIKRGARAEKYEEKAFDFFCDFYLRRFPYNFMEPKKIEYQIPPKEFKVNFPKAMTLTVGHPMRNSTMQNLAVMYAVSLQKLVKKQIRNIYSGSVAEDGKEPELGLLSLRSQTLNTCINMGDWKWIITSPLTDPWLVETPVTKTDLIRYAQEKFIPLEKTRTCFAKDELADGTCHACRKRLVAFKYLGIPDRTEYRRRDGRR